MTFLQKIGYWSLVGSCKLVSLLPRWILYYPFADIIYILLYYVVGYRKKVVKENLKNSFPEKTEAERKSIERKFYQHLAEIFVEGINIAGISKRSLSKRLTITNIEQHEESVKGKNTIFAMAHYGTWESFFAYQLLTESQFIGVYRPLHNKVFDEFYKYSRSRTGLLAIPMNNILRYLLEHKNDDRRLTIGMIADQSPPRWENQHWFTFLNQPSMFFQGVEKIALKFKMPVYFVHIKKLGRARFVSSLELIYDGEENVAHNEITERYKDKLEAMIRECPELWMWSHRRWKHKPDGDD